MLSGPSPLRYDCRRLPGVLRGEGRGKIVTPTVLALRSRRRWCVTLPRFPRPRRTCSGYAPGPPRNGRYARSGRPCASSARRSGRSSARVHGEMLEIAQGGVTGAEIVHVDRVTDFRLRSCKLAPFPCRSSGRPGYLFETHGLFGGKTMSEPDARANPAGKLRMHELVRREIDPDPYRPAHGDGVAPHPKLPATPPRL